jgi:hypothetical protein
MKFKEGRILDRVVIEKNGRKYNVVLRPPRAGDVAKLRELYNRLITQTPFLSRITPVSLMEEKKWLDDLLKKARKKDACCILAQIGGNIVGSTAIERKDGNNMIGLSMYRKFGFRTAGKIPKGIKRKGKYTDDMYKVIG